MAVCKLLTYTSPSICLRVQSSPIFDVQDSSGDVFLDRMKQVSVWQQQRELTAGPWELPSRATVKRLNTLVSICGSCMIARPSANRPDPDQQEAFVRLKERSIRESEEDVSRAREFRSAAGASKFDGLGIATGIATRVTASEVFCQPLAPPTGCSAWDTWASAEIVRDLPDFLALARQCFV